MQLPGPPAKHQGRPSVRPSVCLLFFDRDVSRLNTSSSFASSLNASLHLCWCVYNCFLPFTVCHCCVWFFLREWQLQYGIHTRTWTLISLSKRPV